MGTTVLYIFFNGCWIWGFLLPTVPFYILIFPLLSVSRWWFLFITASRQIPFYIQPACTFFSSQSFLTLIPQTSIINPHNRPNAKVKSNDELQQLRDRYGVVSYSAYPCIVSRCAWSFQQTNSVSKKQNCISSCWTFNEIKSLNTKIRPRISESSSWRSKSIMKFLRAARMYNTYSQGWGRSI